ncbi:MAG: PrsW family intramembrane metalloprotease, partial [Halobacteria archaeon]|nr:PrsW family intramembrane metalloprotease [Halobacteria archaeon]
MRVLISNLVSGLRKILRVSLWEMRKSAGEIRVRTVIVAGIALLLVLGAAPLFADKGVDIDKGMYRVGVSEDNVYYDVAERDATFRISEPSIEALRNGRIDVLIQNDRIIALDSAKGRAAVSELRRSTKNYNTYLMQKEAGEGRRAVAFPVEVTLIYLEQESRASLDSRTGSDGNPGGDGDGNVNGNVNGNGTGVGAGGTGGSG